MKLTTAYPRYISVSLKRSEHLRTSSDEEIPEVNAFASKLYFNLDIKGKVANDVKNNFPENQKFPK